MGRQVWFTEDLRQIAGGLWSTVARTEASADFKRGYYGALLAFCLATGIVEIEPHHEFERSTENDVVLSRY